MHRGALPVRQRHQHAAAVASASAAAALGNAGSTGLGGGGLGHQAQAQAGEQQGPTAPSSPSSSAPPASRHFESSDERQFGAGVAAVRGVVGGSASIASVARLPRHRVASADCWQGAGCRWRGQCCMNGGLGPTHLIARAHAGHHARASAQQGQQLKRWVGGSWCMQRSRLLRVRAPTRAPGAALACVLETHTNSCCLPALQAASMTASTGAQAMRAPQAARMPRKGGGHARRTACEAATPPHASPRHCPCPLHPAAASAPRLCPTSRTACRRTSQGQAATTPRPRSPPCASPAAWSAARAAALRWRRTEAR